MSKTYSFTPYLTGCLALSVIFPLSVDQFECSLQFCHIEFDEEVISDGFRVFMEGEGLILSEFRELSFCGPCGHYFP